MRILVRETKPAHEEEGQFNDLHDEHPDRKQLQMTILATTPDEQVSQLIGTTIEQLDISPEAFATAESCYLDLGERLSEAGAEVYVQGSFLLGTVVRPHHHGGEYDLDLVSRINVAKTSITQQQLKDRIGDLLTEYVKDHTGELCESPAELTPGRRSWCLHYNGFHMDVLPAIPNADVPSPTAIELTDVQLREWQKSDPLRYVTWFRNQCAKQMHDERVRLSKTYGSVEAVPADKVRTPLHRTVQVLKRHRDLYFANDLDDRPPSSLITTLAAKAYKGETDLLAATLGAVQRMAEHIEKRNGKYWVENPGCEDENFADKWNEYEQRRLKFQGWRAAVERDLDSFRLETKGSVAMHQLVAKAFGNEPVEQALKVLGARTNEARTAGSVKFATGGLLTAAAATTAPAAKASAATTVPSHRFFGGPAPR